jgi:hypothetical protein
MHACPSGTSVNSRNSRALAVLFRLADAAHSTHDNLSINSALRTALGCIGTPVVLNTIAEIVPRSMPMNIEHDLHMATRDGQKLATLRILGFKYSLSL